MNNKEEKGSKEDLSIKLVRWQGKQEAFKNPSIPIYLLVNGYGPGTRADAWIAGYVEVDVQRYTTHKHC